jgi:hypothetical protein
MGGQGSGGYNRISVSEHLRRGTYRPSRHGPLPQKVLALPGGRPEAPEPPQELQDAGRELWRGAWEASWLQPVDEPLVLLASQAADDVALARERYQATHEPADARAVVALGKLEVDCLVALGFTPAARARLGVQQVTTMSKLDALRRQPPR